MKSAKISPFKTREFKVRFLQKGRKGQTKKRSGKPVWRTKKFLSDTFSASDNEKFIKEMYPDETFQLTEFYQSDIVAIFGLPNSGEVLKLPIRGYKVVSVETYVHFMDSDKDEVSSTFRFAAVILNGSDYKKPILEGARMFYKMPLSKIHIKEKSLRTEKFEAYFFMDEEKAVDQYDSLLEGTSW